MDDLEREIIMTVASGKEMRLQWREILNKIYPKYKKQQPKLNENTFHVQVQRKLDALVGRKLLKKDILGHPKVFYYIPDNKKNKILNEIWEEIDQILSYLGRFTSTLQSNPDKLRKYFKEKDELNFSAMTKKPFSEANIDEYERKKALLIAPLLDACLNLHRILVNLCFESGKVDCSQYVTVIEGEKHPVTLPLRFLEGVDFGRLDFLHAVHQTGVQKIAWTPTLTGTAFAPQYLFFKKKD